MIINIALLIYGAAFAVLILLLYHCFTNRSHPGSLPITLLGMLVACLYVIGIIELSGYFQSESTAIFLHDLGMLLGILPSSFWLWFLAEIYYKRKIRSKWLLLLFLEPLIVTLLVVSNDYHSLFFGETRITQYHGMLEVYREFNIARQIHSVYFVALLLVRYYLYLIRYLSHQA